MRRDVELMSCRLLLYEHLPKPPDLTATPQGRDRRCRHASNHALTDHEARP